MKAKSVIYKGKVYIYTSIDREPIRISTGIPATKLNKDGLLYKNANVPDVDAANKAILKALRKLQDILDAYPSMNAKQVLQVFKTGDLPAIDGKVVEDVNEGDVIKAFRKFIKDSESGERLSESGTRLEADTIRPYKNVLTNLIKFSALYNLEFENLNNQFYNQFCNFCWNTLGHYDNYVGSQVKIIKAFLKYSYQSGTIKKPIDTSTWKVWKEDIQILVLYKDEIKMIYEMPIECDDKETQMKLEHTRDTFLMGIFTCFRVQQLLNLTEKDLVIRHGEYYINTIVQKTKKHIEVKLNPIGRFIIDKYRNQYETLLPPISEQKFNGRLKKLASYFKEHLKDHKDVKLIGNNWEGKFKRIRTKRAIPEYQFIPVEDVISSHVMRRSGINFLLMAGLTPFEVQAISGHSINSREFGKYVKIASSEVETKSVNAWSSVLM